MERRTRNDLKHLPFACGEGEVESNSYDKVRKVQKIQSDGRTNAIGSRTLATELSCPICLDLLCQTMTAKECLHRFCQECITMALQRGNKECPTCRKKLVSKRSLRADPSFDNLISKIWPDRNIYDQLQTQEVQSLTSITSTEALMESMAEGMKTQDQNRRKRVNGSFELDSGSKRESRRKRGTEEEDMEEFDEPPTADELQRISERAKPSTSRNNADDDNIEEGNFEDYDYDEYDEEGGRYEGGEAGSNANAGEVNIKEEEIDDFNEGEYQYDEYEEIEDEIQTELDELEAIEMEEIEDFDDDEESEDEKITKIANQPIKQEERTDIKIPQTDSSLPRSGDYPVSADLGANGSGPSQNGENEIKINGHGVQNEGDDLSDDDSESSSSTYSSSGCTTTTSADSSTLSIDLTGVDGLDVLNGIEHQMSAQSLSNLAQGLASINQDFSLTLDEPGSSNTASVQRPPPVENGEPSGPPPPAQHMPIVERLTHWLANSPSSPQEPEEDMNKMPERRIEDDDEIEHTVSREIEAELLPALSLMGRECPAELKNPRYIKARSDVTTQYPGGAAVLHKVEHLAEYIQKRAGEESVLGNADYDADPVPNVPKPQHFYVFSRNGGHHIRKIFLNETLATAAAAMTKGDHLVLFFDIREVEPKCKPEYTGMLVDVVPQTFLNLPSI